MTRRACIIRQRDRYEWQVRREAEALLEDGYEVHVIGLRGPGEPAVEVIDGVAVHHLPLNRKRGGKLRYLWDYFGFTTAAALKVARMHRRTPFDVVQIDTMPDFLVFAGLYAKRRGAKVVAFMKEPSPELGETLYGPGVIVKALAWMEQRAIAHADLALTVSDELKDRYVQRGADPAKIQVVINGANPKLLHLDDPPAPDPERYTVICHGSIEERYGHETMLRAIALARKEVPEIRFRILGAGEFVPRMLELIDELDLHDEVAYLGYLSQEDMLGELFRADVGIVAQEASPYSHLVHTNKMFEYMYIGKPAVVSRLDSVSRIVDDRTARYFEPGDAHDLAEALVELRRDPQRAATLASRGRDLAHDLSWSRIKHGYLDLVADTVGIERRG